jgi:peptidylprolyl isomerase
MTKTIENGSTVVLHYRGTFADGTEFDSSHGRGEPMTVEIGTGQLIPGFETNLQGLAAGGSNTFTIGPEEGYGNRIEGAITTLDRSIFPEDFEFTEGMTVPLQGPDGNNVLATLTEINEGEVQADLNHPMAGKDLTFEVEILTVTNNEPTEG